MRSLLLALLLLTSGCGVPQRSACSEWLAWFCDPFGRGLASWLFEHYPIIAGVVTVLGLVAVVIGERTGAFKSAHETTDAVVAAIFIGVVGSLLLAGYCLILLIVGMGIACALLGAAIHALGSRRLVLALLLLVGMGCRNQLVSPVECTEFCRSRFDGPAVFYHCEYTQEGGRCDCRCAPAPGWWWPFRNAAIITPRPTHLARDDRHRLHGVRGPALLYPDGWGIWAWHGVHVPRDVIEAPATITAERIISERNAEIRRVMLERMGHERFLAESGAQPIQRDRYGELLRIELPDDEPLVLVRVVNSTPEPDGSRNRYLLRVPPDVRSAQEGVAWTFNVPPGQYAPVAET